MEVARSTSKACAYIEFLRHFLAGRVHRRWARMGSDTTGNVGTSALFSILSVKMSKETVKKKIVIIMAFDPALDQHPQGK